MANERAFDIVVFGATGFTGGLVADYLAAQAGALRWALAGRDASKLERVRERVAKRGNTPEIIVADASDQHALDELARRTRVVLTTVGPYVRYGEPLVRACAEAGTHYVDLTGEPPFVDLIRERYHATAERNRAKIVNACGFDAIPHDLGAYFTLQQLRKRLSESEQASTPISIEGVVRAGGTISGGTWHSALEIMGSMRSAKPAKTPSPEGRKIGSLPRAIRYDKELGLWLVPMPTIDPLVVLQSARTLPEYGAQFRYGHFSGLEHLHQVAGLIAGVGSVALLAQLKATRTLLGKFKKPGEGPDEATRERSWFRVILRGRAGSQRVQCEVRGGDPGYTETAKMISEAALTLAFDSQKLPEHYGVVTSASALGNTLIDRLVRAGISFTEVSENRSKAESKAQERPVGEQRA